MYRLTERLGYQHPEDFLQAMKNSAELTGWFAYLKVDDEVKAQQIAYAVIKAFGGGKKDQRLAKQTEDEEIIDTTDPKFAEQFKGFNYVKQQPPRKVNRQTSTEILFG